jgi:hypothetical protein
MRRILWCFIAVLITGELAAQNIPREASISISKAIDPIKLDGILDEQSWNEADIATDFYQSFPVDNKLATSQVEAKTTFDDTFFYLGFVCYDPIGGPYIVESLKRDFEFRPTENISVYIDPFDDKTNGFSFSLSPYNVQREGLISGAVEISTDWDNKWYSEVTTYEDKWVVEIAIPFKTLRYKESITNWNIQFIRNDPKTGERSVWTNVKQQFRSNNLAFSGRLIWNDPPPPSGVNISVIPYILGSSSKDYEEDTPNDLDGNAGFDAKVAVTSSLNLDLTVNPDFSQVEVDQQVANLDRFELFFPEKRQFFLENSDLFGNSGFPSSRPFFSRRIGIAQDTADNTVQVPILFGARLSGKLNKDWRIGLMNMQTKATPNTELPGSENINDGYNLSGQNYTSAVLQRKIWARSNIGAIFVNRNATNYDANDTTQATSSFNRVAGLDFNFATADNTWQAKVFLHGSFDPVAKRNAIAQGTYIGYKTRHWALNYAHSYIGEGYNAEVGFVPRTGTFGVGLFRSQYIFYPKKGNIVTIRPGADFRLTYKPGNILSDQQAAAALEVNYKNTSNLKANMSQQYTLLFDDFDPTRTDGPELPEGSDYNYFFGTISYDSDTRKVFTYVISAQYGSYFNGYKFTGVSEIGYKFRPYGSISVSAVYNDVQLPEPYNSSSFWIISPRLDLTFTNKLFLTTFVQYNEQAENMNINARFQWRFAPVSDLFIVYTDNYLPTEFMQKNRSVVLKLSYWLNL